MLITEDFVESYFGMFEVGSGKRDNSEETAVESRYALHGSFFAGYVASGRQLSERSTVTRCTVGRPLHWLCGNTVAATACSPKLCQIVIVKEHVRGQN